MIATIIKDTKSRMDKSLQALQSEMQRVRTGRAHPSLLEHIQVEYYSNMTPLAQVANVAIEDARTLTVTPWEKDMVPVIEKAILESGLGLNPMTAGTVMRIPLPPLTEDRRKELVRIIKQHGENSKISIRNIRRDANTAIKGLLKDKELAEDEARRYEDEVQQITDKNIEEIDVLLQQKEAELLEV